MPTPDDRRAARRLRDDRPALSRSMDDALEVLRAYLQAAGYRALRRHAWPPWVIDVFANDECDRVVLMANRFGCLELRPLDVHSVGDSPARSRSRPQDRTEDGERHSPSQ
jgi:hypothetical protein